MKYNVKISIKEGISDKEKSERINQFRQSFVTAATDYYAFESRGNNENQQTALQKVMRAKQETA
jgi:hypothetical protein